MICAFDLNQTVGVRHILEQNQLNPSASQNPKALFGCSRIHINPHVLGWVGVEIELNSIPIHSNTCGLR